MVVPEVREGRISRQRRKTDTKAPRQSKEPRMAQAQWVKREWRGGYRHGGKGKGLWRALWAIMIIQTPSLRSWKATRGF